MARAVKPPAEWSRKARKRNPPSPEPPAEWSRKARKRDELAEARDEIRELRRELAYERAARRHEAAKRRAAKPKHKAKPKPLPAPKPAPKPKRKPMGLEAALHKAHARLEVERAKRREYDRDRAKLRAELRAARRATATAILQVQEGAEREREIAELERELAATTTRAEYVERHGQQAVDMADGMFRWLNELAQGATVEIRADGSVEGQVMLEGARADDLLDRSPWRSVLTDEVWIRFGARWRVDASRWDRYATHPVTVVMTGWFRGGRHADATLVAREVEAAMAAYKHATLGLVVQCHWSEDRQRPKGR